jgi:hypothetical protein
MLLPPRISAFHCAGVGLRAPAATGAGSSRASSSARSGSSLDRDRLWLRLVPTAVPGSLVIKQLTLELVVGALIGSSTRRRRGDDRDGERNSHSLTTHSRKPKSHSAVRTAL